jgi:ankyrin repeat protein
MDNDQIPADLLADIEGFAMAWDDVSPFELAIEGNHVDEVQQMVEEDPSLLEPWDELPLHRAVTFGAVDVIEYLLDQGVDINYQCGLETAL